MEKNERVNEMLAFLSPEDRGQFLSDLLQAVENAKNVGNFEYIDACIDDWEDIVELNSIPGLKDRVWTRFNNLKNKGRMN